MGQELPYEQGEELLGKFLRVSVRAKQLERLCNCYGRAIADRLSEEHLDQARESEVYAMLDGSMVLTRGEGWKEVKLGRVFERQDMHALHPGRKEITHSRYVASILGLRPFLEQMETAIPTRSQLVFVADGAKWIWRWVDSLYPGAVQILDYYHAMEHATDFATLQFPVKNQRVVWLDKVEQWLNNGQLDLVLEEIHALAPVSTQASKSRDALAKYYWNNYNRMQYKTFKEQGLLIGSGPIESAHRTVIQKRMKLSGQRWNIDNAQKMLNLRVAKKSRKWDYIVDSIRRAA